MKKEIITPSGHIGMIIDCGIYEVEIFKSIDGGCGLPIKYTSKKSYNSIFTPPAFFINWDEDKDGGKLAVFVMT